MRAWDIVDIAPVPDDDASLYLLQRGPAYSIHVDEYELMNNQHWDSEVALSDEVCDRLGDREAAQVLVGGLGMGFTLAAVLRRMDANARVTVAELMPAVVRWNRELCGKASGHPLRDPRVRVELVDVCDWIDSNAGPWDAILLDVDNGPGATTRPTNGWLYTDAGLERLKSQLTPTGVLGVWSGHADPDFTQRLQLAGYEAEVIEVSEPARPGPDPHVLWVATPVPGARHKG